MLNTRIVEYSFEIDHALDTSRPRQLLGVIITRVGDYVRAVEGLNVEFHNFVSHFLNVEFYNFPSHFLNDPP